MIFKLLNIFSTLFNLFLVSLTVSTSAIKIRSQSHDLGTSGRLANFGVDDRLLEGGDMSELLEVWLETLHVLSYYSCVHGQVSYLPFGGEVALQIGLIAVILERMCPRI